MNNYWKHYNKKALNQKVVVNIRVYNSEEIKIQRCVRQGCIISPVMLNIYLEGSFKEAINGGSGDVIINEQNQQYPLC